MTTRFMCWKIDIGEKRFVIKSTRISPALVTAIFALVLLFCSNPCAATIIKVLIVEKSGDVWVYPPLKDDGKPVPDGTQVSLKQGNYSNTVGTVRGQATFESIPPEDQKKTYTVTYNNEEFPKENVYKKKKTTYIISTKQKEEQDKSKDDDKKQSFNGLPFLDSSGVYIAPDDDAVFGCIGLYNPTAQSYLLSPLSIYSDIPDTFFNDAQYASAEAIASGTLLLDSVDEGRTLYIDALGADEIGPWLNFPIDPMSPDTYALTVGTATPIIGPGEYGDPVNFSAAIRCSVIPEPTTIVLLCLGGLALLRRRRR